MDSKTLDYIICSLQETKAGLLQDFTQCVHRIKSGEMKEALGSGHEEGDCSTVYTSNAMNLQKMQAAQKTINLVDRALKKIEQGDYGTCASCFDSIEERRLRSIPFAIYCRECQEQQDMEGRGQRMNKICVRMASVSGHGAAIDAGQAWQEMRSSMIQENRVEESFCS